MPHVGGFPHEGSGSLTIVHISGMRSRAHEAEAGEALIRQLDRDLAQSADGQSLHPDLIVVTGDLADSGLPGDYTWRSSPASTT
jgi:3',5'-cyclic AMP phosphodiesterase CpdA